jgi:hypothetical protein
LGLREKLKMMPYEDGLIDPLPDVYGWDGATVHDFETETQILGAQRRLDFRPLIQALGDRPLIVSAFGSAGIGRNPIAGEDRVYSAAVSQAASIILHLNDGAAGFLRWCWSGHGEVSTTQPNHFMPLRFDERRMLWRIHRPVYFSHAVQARYVKPGWRTWPLTLAGGGDERNIRRLFAAVASSADQRDWTILLVNDAAEIGQAEFSWPEDWPVPQRLRQLQVTGPNSMITNAGDIAVSEGRISVSVPARSIVTLTTLEPGDLAEPLGWEVGRGMRELTR